MADPLIYHHHLTIKTDKERVWDALINPDMTRHYMFGCEAISDWKTGSPLVWRGSIDHIDYVIGKVVEFIENEMLSFTVFGPNEGYEDIPENYLTSTYKLTYTNGETFLDISQGDYSQVEDGLKRYRDAAGGWDIAMQGLKKLLEA